MKTRPWYRRYPDNFLTGMARLTLEEKGAYNVVVDLIYARGGPIADEPRWIAGLCNCSVRRWTTIRARLIELGKLVAADGSLWNERAIAELGSAVKEAEKLSENGAKGGNKSAEMRAAAKENNGLSQAPVKHIRGHISEPLLSPKGTKGGKKDIEGYGDDSDPLYAEFLNGVWNKRWKRDGHNRFKAFGVYARLPDADREAVKANIERCARALVADRSEAKFRPMLQSWLNGRGWEVDTDRTEGEAVDWSAWVAHHRAGGDWNEIALGPAPGHPGCRVPAEYLTTSAAEPAV